MSFPRTLHCLLFSGFLLVSLLPAGATFSFAGSVDDIDIRNFGKIDDNYYRGGQPEEEDFIALRKLGVRTVIDLQEKGKRDEPKWVENAGMKFFKIRLSTTRRPTAEETEYFLKLVNDPENQPVFVHCAGGKHRTGSMTAIYRITHDAWTAERAYQEMEEYGYYDFPSPLHLFGLNQAAHKKHVFDYYEKHLRAMKRDGVLAGTSAGSASGTESH